VNSDERSTLIKRYGAGPAELRRAWESVPVEARTWRPEPEEWSAHEIVVHCADSEAYAAVRIRLLVAEPEPLIVGYDQEQWVEAFGYRDLPVAPAFAVVDAVRASTFALIEQLPDWAWSTTGRHTESGAYSAEDWLRTYAAHLHDHADQIRANIEAWNLAQA